MAHVADIEQLLAASLAADAGIREAAEVKMKALFCRLARFSLD